MRAVFWLLLQPSVGGSQNNRHSNGHSNSAGNSRKERRKQQTAQRWTVWVLLSTFNAFSRFSASYNW